MADLRVRNVQIFDPVLTTIARDYKPHSEDMIADLVAPRVPVRHEFGEYLVWDTGANFRNDTDFLVDDRAQSKEIDTSYVKETYAAKEYRGKVSISQRELENATDGFDLQRKKVEYLTNKFMLQREVRVASALSSVTTNATPSNNWNVDAATIEADIITGIEAIFDLTGMAPNSIIIPFKVANAIAVQQDIREIIKYTVNGQDTLALGAGILPKTLWGLNVFVPKVGYHTNREGGTASVSNVWGDEVKILTVNPEASTSDPSTMVSFTKRPRTVTTWHENDPDVDYIGLSEILDEKLVSPDSGYELRNLLS